MTINIKSAEDIEAMRHACRLASEVLDYIAPHIKPGITTKEIDRLGAECMAQQGTISATVGYQPPGYPPYPASLCTSVNHVVCHGIPNDKPLKKGDIVNVDVTVPAVALYAIVACVPVTNAKACVRKKSSVAGVLSGSTAMLK